MISMNSIRVAALCCLLPLCVGCANSGGTYRGQSPMGAGPYGPGHQGCPTCAVGGGAGCGNGSCSTGGCGNGGYGNGGCGNGGYGDPYAGYSNGPGGPNDWYPTHRHHFHYTPPKNLVYPAQNQPTAMVQYPYYTVKGPSDFFLGAFDKKSPSY